MKKWIVAPLVGGIILFIWQFLSWSMINLHQSTQQYSPKQDVLMNTLKSEGIKEGGYIIPMLPPTASTEEWQQFMKEAEGKPWASIQYHNSLKNNMGMNMFRGMITNFITVLLLCWILMRMQAPAFSTIVMASLFTGLIVFLNAAYTNFIWYEGFDIWGHLLDSVVSWGLCGVWLGWWLRRTNRVSGKIAASARSVAVH